MDKSYLKLFTELAHATEVLAEQVMELDKVQNDTKGEETAKIMRDDYAKLHDYLRGDAFDPSTLEKKDFAKLLVGAIIVAQQLENKIEAERKALNGYKVDVIPKLERVVNETNSLEEIQKLAEELFSIQEIEKTDN